MRKKKPWLRRVTIGDCILLLGDSLEILPVLSDITHVIGDPPYEDELHAGFTSTNRIRRDGRAVGGDLGFEGVNAVRHEIARICVEASSGWVILFTLAEGVREWRDGLQAAGANYGTCCAWVKPDAMPRMNAQGPARGFECFVTAWTAGGYKRWNAGGKRGVYKHTCNPPSRDGRHPTEKPTALMTEILADFTSAGELVCDPFMGSGSTGIAAMRLDRPFIGIERDEASFAIAVERLRAEHKQPRLGLERQPKIKTADMFEEDAQ